MEREVKVLEYYFNSNKYNEFDIAQRLEEEKKGFPDRIIEMELKLNEFGMYIAKLKFRRKENKAIKVIKQNKLLLMVKKYKNKPKAKIKRIEKYNVQPKKYGQYKSTGTFKPF